VIATGRPARDLVPSAPDFVPPAPDSISPAPDLVPPAPDLVLPGAGRRARGLVVYGTAAALLVAGGFWWFRSAPYLGPDPKLERWHVAAERRLPAGGPLADSGTIDLAAGADRAVQTRAAGGIYEVQIVCVGDPGSSVRISLGDVNDSGRGMACTEQTPPTSFPIGVADALVLHVAVDGTGPVVVRYTLTRQVP
jgi:hypothetical protein